MKKSPASKEALCRALVASALAVSAAAVSARGEEWPCWLGPRRDGTSRERSWSHRWPPDGPPRAWQRAIGSGYSAVVVAGGRLVLFHRRGHRLIVDALDPRSGRDLWRFSYPTRYVDRYGYDGGPRCSPAIDSGVVFTLGPAGILHALDLETGRLRWRHDIRSEEGLEPNFFGTGAAPVAEGGVIYAHLGGTETGSGLAVAYEVKSGRQRWKQRTDGGSYASPTLATIDGTRHLFVFHRGGLSSLDPEGGRERWKFPWRARAHESVNGATPLVVGDLVFVSAAYRTGSACLRVGTGGYREVWKDGERGREHAMELHWAPPIYFDGHVYGFSGRHAAETTLRCVELATGRVKWSWRSPLYRGSMLRAGERCIALGELGDLFVLKLNPAGHEVLATLHGVLGRPAWTMPVLSEGLLYLRDQRQLIALDLRPKPPATQPPLPDRPRRSGEEARRPPP